MNQRSPESPRLLIAEHDEDLGGQLQRMLGAEGFRVTHARTAEQTIRQLGDEVFALVLLGVGSSPLDGLELCRRIKSSPATADVPVMFLSHETNGEGLPAQALAAGACDCLTRPFGRTDVVARVRCITHQRIELLSLKQSQLHDRLTGLPKGEYFKARLDEELAESVRFASPVSIVLADISDLNAVHEQQGAAVGERWLERFALVLRSECRRYDVVGRLEGMMFGIMLPRVSAGGAIKAARRLSEVWRLTTLEAGGLDFYVPAIMAVESHSGSAAVPSATDLVNRAITSLQRIQQGQGPAVDGVVGPSPDPYAVSIWSDYLTPVQSGCDS